MLRTSRHRQNSGQLCSDILPEQGQSPLQHTYLHIAASCARSSVLSVAALEDVLVPCHVIVDELLTQQV